MALEGNTRQFPLFTPQQEQFTGNILNQLPQLLSNIQGSFQPGQNQLMSQIQEQIVPTIAERFTAMGKGAQSSPSFAGALSQGIGKATGEFQGQERTQLLQLLQLLLGAGLQPQYDTVYEPSSGGGLSGLLSSGLKTGLAGAAAGSAAGPIGAGVGGGVGLLAGLLGS